jgi:hypothetical protein
MRQRGTRLIGVLAATLVFSGIARAQSLGSTASITQYGITWTFSEAREHGTYANGDFWVVGPVTITSITPYFTGAANGWEVNPQVRTKQGLQDGCYNGGTSFDATLVPALPYLAQPGQSILKAVSSGVARPCVQTAAVLTVVTAAPPDGGATVFRPPYVGTDKPNYSTTSLRLDLLPSLAPVAGTPTLESIAERFRRVQMDHIPGGLSQGIRPIDNLPDYGAELGRDEAHGLLRLMLNDPIASKMPALVRYLQNGIDMHHMVLGGHTWPPGGGEQPCHTLPWAFAAVMLDREDFRAKIAELARERVLYNDHHAYRGQDGRALYGKISAANGWRQGDSETMYWGVMAAYTGTPTTADPYGYIDTKHYVVCCVAQPWKGMALALHLMPSLKAVWQNRTVLELVDRWVALGHWTQPDPCAPAPALTSQQWANRAAYGYGVTWGPDPANPGMCILDANPADGIGRIPEMHGNPDSGNYGSPFTDAMWAAYRSSAPAVGASRFVPLAPCRLLDTRVTSGAGAAAPAIAAQARRVFAISGECGVPGGASAISANATVVAAGAIGDLRITGAHLASTATSAVSIPLARARANNAIIELAADGTGKIAVTNDSSGSVQFILDLNGYFL